MIITRSPLRITLGGGGTDLPSYYRDHTGFLIAGVVIGLVAPVFCYPYSRTVWSAIDIGMTPLEPHEIAEADEALARGDA